MLVLGRKLMQSIMINDDPLQVVGVSNVNKVRTANVVFKGDVFVLPYEHPVDITPDVTVTLMGSKTTGTQVRLGIDAPDDVAVHRSEIYEQIKDGVAA